MKSKGGGEQNTITWKKDHRKVSDVNFFYIFHKLLKKNHLNKSHDFLATCSLITPGPDLLCTTWYLDSHVPYVTWLAIPFPSHKCLTCRITLLIKALIGCVNSWDVPWKYHKTIPPLLKIEKKSNILLLVAC